MSRILPNLLLIYQNINDIIITRQYVSIYSCKKGSGEMNPLIHFDMASVFVLTIILFTNVYRRMVKGTVNKVFMLLISTALVAALFEVVMIFIIGADGNNDKALIIIKSFYLIAHNFATPVYLMYIISLTKTWNKVVKRPLLFALLCVPFVLIFLFIVSNLFTGFLFTFENNVQIKHNTYLLYICAGIYILYSMIYVIYYRNLFTKCQIYSLASMLPLTIAAVVVQKYYPNSLVEIFSNTVGIMLMSMLIQRPEQIMDSATMLRKYSAYADDMKKNFANDNHVELIMVNIANYSSLHNILGYDGTNLLLRTVARKISEITKKSKSYADLFYLDRGRFRIVVNEHYSSLAPQLAEDINEMLKETYSTNHIDMNLIGYVCRARCPEDIGDFRALTAFGADLHKKLSYSGEVIVTEELFKQRNFSLTNELDNIIERALDNNSFKVYYQPIYSVKEKRFTTAEALIRLIDDIHGFVPPDIFIPAAERSGAIHKIGSFVLNDVCRFIASDEFKKLGLDYIEINLSVAQCMKSGLADEVMHTIAKYGVKPSQINLEVTETAASHNQSAMTDNLNILSAAGVSFSLDDFGTGYSNMDRLTTLPLKIVKLDRTFVNSQDRPKMKIFLENIIKMFKEMQMEIVVEGIENEQMVERFSELNCDYIQGYYFSKPLPENEFIGFIKNHQ